MLPLSRPTRIKTLATFEARIRITIFNRCVISLRGSLCQLPNFKSRKTTTQVCHAIRANEKKNACFTSNTQQMKVL